MPPSVYLETTILSYLTADPSRDLVTAAHQRLTADWWRVGRPQCTVYASAIVLDEARAGDPEVARRRLELLEGVPLLEVGPEALALAGELVRCGLVPGKANADALHVAVAAVGRVDYLLTWNIRHLAGAAVRRAIERALRARGTSHRCCARRRSCSTCRRHQQTRERPMRSEIDRDKRDVDAPTDDEIVAEVRATRETLAAAAGNDLQRYYEQLKAIEAVERARGRAIVAPPTGSATPEPGASAS